MSFTIFGLARRHRALAAEMLRDLGLYPGQEIMLLQLWENDGQSQNSLGRTLGLDHSTVAKSVRRLEEAGLVVRARSARDRRTTIVTLTQAGRNLESAVTEVWARLEECTVAGFSAAERQAFVLLARRIEANLDPDTPAAPAGGPAPAPLA
ncbi:MarR family winged helix-turn-helix transcriptional regulator [Streptomyces sp. SP17KL33]|uniref:MarR family winged helix-turn-helix transcriptional regulator n=1 Tax=Streptomyces sp. SP17KL33 TaxID=3002534 RepID=UPI002E76FB34|nr:MarR family transcriptional regulator [Streptomyces sp. SP17KL33]MEE1758252.1 MarR family transcriptional regulator [Streptomyces sp. SP18BB07]